MLITLTRDHSPWSDTPDVTLTWQDLLTPLCEARESAAGNFERHFWDHFKSHVEALMPTFDGFSVPSRDVFAFLKEIDLLLQTLLRAMGVAGSAGWHQDRAAYWIKDLGGVGFWWWHGDWNNPVVQNAFAVWRTGENQPVQIASLEEIMRGVEIARKGSKLGEYFAQLAARVRPELEHGAPA